MSFLNNLITGISLGSVYAIIALGYTMVYGIAKMLNFAHGDVIMVGAYMIFFATGSFGLNPIVGILLAVVVCTVLGVVIEGLAYKPLRQASSLAVLITAIGVSYFLQNAALLLWGRRTPRCLPPSFPRAPCPLKGVNITYVSLVTVLVCIVIMLALTWFTSKTKMGKAMRACSENKDAARLMGIGRQPHHLHDLCHRLRPGGHRQRPALLQLQEPDPHQRLPARHQGLYRAVFGGIGSIPAPCWAVSYWHHRDLCQGDQHQHLRRGGLRRAHHRAAGQACGLLGKTIREKV